MDYFESNKSGRTFFLRLDQGDLVLESIEALIEREGIKNAVVQSMIGTLDYCTMHMVTTTGYPIVEYFDKKDDMPLELAVGQGIIADGVPHLHVVISDKDKAYAGHLETGCRVLYLAEVVIQEYLDIDLYRAKDDKGVNQLKSR